MNLTNRDWGYYRVLYELPGIKVKELVVQPRQSLSMQVHQLRNEYWIVASGTCYVRQYDYDGMLFDTILNKHDTITINTNDWHQLVNISDETCVVIEVQYGIDCIEQDIIRK